MNSGRERNRDGCGHLQSYHSSSRGWETITSLHSLRKKHKEIKKNNKKRGMATSTFSEKPDATINN
jgi:hypothetical protein